VILNRPTEHVLRDLAFTADEDATRPFADNRLYMGGDVGQSSTIVVTSSDAVVDATEVAAGIRVCTVGAAAAAVRAGKASAQEFRFFGQYSGWGPGQLQRECKAGVWFVASVSSQLALNEKLAVGTELWHEVLMTMGGPYAELSQLVQDGERLSPGELKPGEEGQ
jgi:putative transcriptional regulator